MNINFKNTIKFITDPKTAGVAAFVGVGAYKTCKDYKNATPERKRRVLAKDLSILAGSTIAFMAVSPGTKWLCSKEFIKGGAKAIERLKNRLKTTDFYKTKIQNKATKFSKFVRGTNSAVYTSLETTEHVLKQCVGGVINTFAGILGAIYTNEFMHKYLLNKPFFNPKPVAASEKNTEKLNDKTAQENRETGEKKPQLKEKTDKKPTYFEQKDVFKNFDTINKGAHETASRVITTMADLPDLKVLEKPMMALTGLSIANTKGYHNKFKKTTYELLANTLVPTFFVTIASMALKNAQPIVKYPTMFISLVAGAFTGGQIADKYKKQIDDRIDQIDMRYIAVK